MTDDTRAALAAWIEQLADHKLAGEVVLVTADGERTVVVESIDVAEDGKLTIRGIAVRSERRVVLTATIGPAK